MEVTFGDLPVVAESPAQRDGDGRQVGHGVAVAVHPAVSSRADRLRRQTGAALEARVRDAPHGSTSVTARGEKNTLKNLSSIGPSHPPKVTDVGTTALHPDILWVHRLYLPV